MSIQAAAPASGPEPERNNREIQPSDNGEPSGPSPDEEAAFLAAEKTDGPRPAGPAVSAAMSGPVGELPPLEDLVKRIPPATRELAEQLFRAKFIGVRQVPRK